jgi:hypothetical protein
MFVMLWMVTCITCKTAWWHNSEDRSQQVLSWFGMEDSLMLAVRFDMYTVSV